MKIITFLFAILAFCAGVSSPYAQDIPARGLAQSAKAGLASTNAVLSTINPTRISARPPQPSDDTGSVGDHWNASEQPNGRLWRMAGNSPGSAQWIIVSPSRAGVGDQVSGAVGIYAIRKQRAAYAGAAIQVTRTSDSMVHDVPFLADNDMNWADGDAFCAASSCWMSKLYDESGNAADCVQTDSTKAVQWGTTYVNGKRALSFDGTTALSAPNLIQRYCVLPAGLTENMSTSTVMWVGKNKTGYSNQAFWQLGLNSAGVYQGLANTFTANTRNGFQIFRQSNNIQSPTPPTSNLDVLMLVNSASSMTLYRNDEAALATGVVPTNSTLTGGYIGAVDWTQSAVNTSYNAVYDFEAFIVWSRTLSAAEQLTAREAAYAQFGVVTQFKVNICEHGDSLHFAFGPPGNRNPMYQVEQALPFKARISNFATSGYRVADVTGMFSYTCATRYAPGKLNELIVAIATNDMLTDGTSAAALESAITPTLVAARTQGWKLIGVPVPNASGYVSAPAKDTQRLAWNAWLRSSGYFDAIAPWDTEPTINNLPANCNATWFIDSPACLHPTEAGDMLLAPSEVKAIESVVPPGFGS